MAVYGQFTLEKAATNGNSNLCCYMSSVMMFSPKRRRDDQNLSKLFSARNIVDL